MSAYSCTEPVLSLAKVLKYTRSLANRGRVNYAPASILQLNSVEYQSAVVYPVFAYLSAEPSCIKALVKGSAAICKVRCLRFFLIVCKNYAENFLTVNLCTLHAIVLGGDVSAFLCQQLFYLTLPYIYVKTKFMHLMHEKKNTVEPHIKTSSLISNYLW